MSQAGINNTSSIPPAVPTQFTTDDGAHVVPLLNNLNVFGGIGANTTGNVGTGTVTVNVKNDSFLWSEKTANFNAAVQNGYYCNNALTVLLPATLGPPDLAIGATIIIYVDTTDTIVITCQADQSIQVGFTIKPAGSFMSNTRGSLLELNFKPSDTTWHTIASMGTWT